MLLQPPRQTHYLLVLVLLQVARRHQAFWVDVCADWLDELGVRVHVLHLQEGQNVLDLQVVRAVCHGLAFGSQATRSHPLSVLFFLRDISEESERPWRMPDDGEKNRVLPCRSEARSRSCHRPQGSAA